MAAARVKISAGRLPAAPKPTRFSGLYLEHVAYGPAFGDTTDQIENKCTQEEYRKYMEEREGKKGLLKLITMLCVMLVILHSASPAQAGTTSMYGHCLKANSPTGYCLVIDKKKHLCAVYRRTNKKSRWKQYATFQVTVGAGGKTRSGTFKVAEKSYYRDFKKTTAFYWVRLAGSSGGLHTTLYKRGSRDIRTAKPVDKRLGMDLSNGCVRLSRWNAYWCYYNLPRGTKVVIF